MKLKMLIIIATLLMATAQSKQEVNRYIAPLVNEVVVVVPEEKMVINGPFGDEVEFCGSKSNYFCVDHPVFWLAIPKNIQTLQVEDEWEHSGSDYKILAIFENSKFKKFKSKELYIIKGSNVDNGEVYFAYTVEQGVIYREADKSLPLGTLILDGDYGFGAINQN